MATLISCATGNWTDASTWKLCSALSGAELDSETNSATLGTSYVYSSSFTTVGTLEIDGVAVKIANRTTPPVGTITVCIGQGGTPVTGTEVTIDVADIDYTASSATVSNQSYGWYFFKFSSPVTLSATTAYTVGAKTSNSSYVWLYRDSTSNNWSRLIRTTTTQAPAAGDKLFVIGEHTGQGTGNSFTVTMNNNDTTDYGTGSTTLSSLGVGKRGTLTWSYAANTNLRLSGLFWIWSSGVVNIGTVANPIGASYTAKVEFDCAAAGDFGLIKGYGGSLVIQGNALSYDRAKLAADVSQGASSLTTDVSTGWKNGDTIVIASTSRTYSEYEIKTLNGDASGTTVNITGTFSYAHSGSGVRVGDIIHLTRNVNITVVSGKEAYNAYILLYTGGTVGSSDIDWAGFSELGSSSTGSKYGVYLTGTAESINIQRCSFFYNYECFITSANNFVFSNNVICPHTSMSSAYDGAGLYVYGYAYSTGVNSTIENITIIGSTPGSSSNYLFYVQTGTGTISNIIASSCQARGMYLGLQADLTCSISNITIYSCGSYGFQSSSTWGRQTITNMTIWCCNSIGLVVSVSAFSGVVFNNLVTYGNVNYNISFSGVISNVLLNGGASHSLASYTTGYHFYFATHVNDLVIRDMNLGGTATGKIDVNSSGVYLAGCYDLMATFHNCTWGAITRFYVSTEWESNTGDRDIYLAFSKDNGEEGNDWAWGWGAYCYHDTSNGVDGTDCLKISPWGDTRYFDTSLILDKKPMFQCPAQDGTQRNVYIKVKKTADFDGTDVDLSLWQSGTKVVDWTAIEGTLSSSDYTEYSLPYTPTEDGILDMAIRLNGTVGSLYVDEFRWT